MAFSFACSHRSVSRQFRPGLECDGDGDGDGDCGGGKDVMSDGRQPERKMIRLANDQEVCEMIATAGGFAFNVPRPTGSR